LQIVTGNKTETCREDKKSSLQIFLLTQSFDCVIFFMSCKQNVYLLQKVSLRYSKQEKDGYVLSVSAGDVAKAGAHSGSGKALKTVL
jgi:hypothetical protein